MASLERNKGSDRFRISFRYAGRKFNRTLKTASEKEASACCERLEENLRLLERGRLEIPPGADPVTFLLSGGKLNGKPQLIVPLSLGEFFPKYQASLPDGAKERNTIETEATHIAHLLRILGSDTSTEFITTDRLQTYVEARERENGLRGRRVSHATIRKEIGTLASIWNTWAFPRGHVHGPAPTKGLRYAKQRERPPFQTWQQIERQIGRRRLSTGEQDDLWACLFLSVAEIEQVLDHVRENARFAFVYPMFAFAAYTGARRSEILRSELDDFDFTGKTVRIREKKRDRTIEFTFRHVPMGETLASTMSACFDRHPGGRWTICSESGEPLSVQMASHHFRWVVEGSRWDRLRGWHVFRHSFASNCAARGIDQRIIDAWMGHQTDEMRRRYRHLFPDEQQQALRLVFTGQRQ